MSLDSWMFTQQVTRIYQVQIEPSSYIYWANFFFFGGGGHLPSLPDASPVLVPVCMGSKHKISISKEKT